MTDKIYLGSFLREGISENYSYIKPYSNFINPLAPTIELTFEIIKRLIAINVIFIHPDTDLDFIEINDNLKVSYTIHKVKWALNVKSEGFERVPLVESIINPPDLMESDYEEAFTLWRKIALYESIEYFKYSIRNILGIDYSIGEKTITILQDLIHNYSVSQIYGILYKSTNNALRFKAEKGGTAKRAANTIIGNAQSFGERAKLSGWQLQKYSRIKECPESVLSKFFFERILKIGYKGFDEVPDINSLK